jgi:predicted acyl esterase
MSPVRRSLLILVAACAVGTTAIASATASAAMTARGSIEQAYVLGAQPRATLQLTRKGKVLASGRADRFGSKIFRDLPAKAGYRVRTAKGPRRTTRPFAVLGRASSNPPAAFFKGQKLHAGLNYVTMRDGVELAMTVRLPIGKTLADGPFPVLIEDSGYQTAAPHDLLASLVSSVSGGTAKADPLAPATSTVVGAVVGPLFGFVTVSVQMRGSGCSGGAFDLFGLPSTYDGYDAVETVAAQSWAKGHKAGLVGISFSGITQLFTAGTRPPHLAAIAPMSVTDDLYSGATFPGGILNSGFASAWTKERMDDAAPAPAGGQPWAKALTKAGDKHCIANQKLRLQTQDATKQIHDNPFRTPALFDDRAAAKWMKNINVPTFLVGQFQDEQTGPHFAEALKQLAKNPNVWITMQNGVHSDSLGPTSITRWAEFLQLYVADQIPTIPPTILSLSGELYKFLADAGASPVLQSRFAGTADVAAAKATFARDPRVRLLMDNGAGTAGPGSIGATWELNYGAWPVREAKATSYFLGANGTLTAAKPPAAATESYVSDPKARPAQTLPGNGETDAWKAQPPYDWAPIAAGKGLGFTTAPLTADVITAGSSSLDLYVKSSARDTDFQVTLSEVRPDGNETYVQNGWLRASHRKLDAAASTTLDPVPTHLASDAAPLPSGAWTLVRVPISAQAHAFRAGSRIRVTVEAPGGDRPRWRLASIDTGKTRNTVSLGGVRASRLVLPVVAGATAGGTPLPAPTALRGEPNRRYAPASNGG